MERIEVGFVGTGKIIRTVRDQVKKSVSLDRRPPAFQWRMPSESGKEEKAGCKDEPP